MTSPNFTTSPISKTWPGTSKQGMLASSQMRALGGHKLAIHTCGPPIPMRVRFWVRLCFLMLFALIDDACRNCISGHERPGLGTSHSRKTRIVTRLSTTFSPPSTCLEPKDDGSKDFETFNDLVGSSQSDASVLDAANDSQDHHDSTPAQSESPSQPCEEAAFFSQGTLPPESYSSTSSRPPSSANQSMESSPINSEQTTARPTISRMPFSQLLAEYTSSRPGSSPPYPQHP
jgi:hypothetical protein